MKTVIRNPSTAAQLNYLHHHFPQNILALEENVTQPKKSQPFVYNFVQFIFGQKIGNLKCCEQVSCVLQQFLV